MLIVYSQLYNQYYTVIQHKVYINFPFPMWMHIRIHSRTGIGNFHENRDNGLIWGLRVTHE